LKRNLVSFQKENKLKAADVAVVEFGNCMLVTGNEPFFAVRVMMKDLD